MPDYEFEKNALNNGYKLICGIDEAGRGPLAGPVCAAAVILPVGCEIEGLNDSKKLSEKKREALFPVIIDRAVAYSVCFAEVDEIEKYNILRATLNAMTRAFESLDPSADYALIDGNIKPPGIRCCETIVKGDSRSMSVAAASILAKVSRDRLMYEYDKKYPVYGFAQHKGYGTKLHIDAIKEYGPSEIHRLSFLKGILENE